MKASLPHTHISCFLGLLSLRGGSGRWPWCLKRGGRGKLSQAPALLAPKSLLDSGGQLWGHLELLRRRAEGTLGRSCVGCVLHVLSLWGQPSAQLAPLTAELFWSVDGGGGETPAETRRLDLCKRPKFVMTGLEPLPSATLGPACCPSGFLASLCLPVLCWHLTGWSPRPCRLGWQGEAGGGAQRGLQCREERGLSSRVWAFGGGCQISPGAEHCSS